MHPDFVDPRITGPKITQAKVLSNRTKAIEDAKEKIAQASAKSNLSLLNEGLEMAIQLGLTGPEISAAVELRDQLQDQQAKFDEVNAAAKTLAIKTESPSGIVASDIAPLEAVTVAHLPLATRCRVTAPRPAG